MLKLSQPQGVDTFTIDNLDNEVFHVSNRCVLRAAGS